MTLSAQFIGDCWHREFQEAVTWLKEYTDASFAPTLEQANRRLAESAAPDVIVLAQSRPDTLPHSEIELLQRNAPRARLIALLGSWCEGTLRKSVPWPGVTPVYWHQFVPRLPSVLAAREEWSPTAGSSPESVPHRGGLVAIRANTLETYQAIANPCADLGYATGWMTPGKQLVFADAVAGVFDCPSAIVADRIALSNFVAQLAGAPVIALLGFPRTDDWRVAHSAGAATVLSKPFLHEELWSALQSLPIPRKLAASLS